MKHSIALRAMVAHINEKTESPTLKGLILPNFTRLAILIESYENTINRQVASDTPAAHSARIVKNGKLLQKKITAISNENLNTISLNVGKLKSEARALAKLRPQSNSEEQEIRAIVRGMSTKDQYELLGQHDPQIVSALMGVNPLLHGIAPEFLGRIVDAMMENAAPSQMNEAAELLDFVKTDEKVYSQANAVVKAAISSEHIEGVLKESQIAEVTHANFMAQLSD